MFLSGHASNLNTPEHLEASNPQIHHCLHGFIFFWWGRSAQVFEISFYVELRRCFPKELRSFWLLRTTTKHILRVGGFP